MSKYHAAMQVTSWSRDTQRLKDALTVLQEFVDASNSDSESRETELETARIGAEQVLAGKLLNRNEGPSRWTKLSDERNKLLAASDAEITDIWRAIFPDEEQPDKAMAVEHIVEYRRKQGLFD